MAVFSVTLFISVKSIRLQASLTYNKLIQELNMFDFLSMQVMKLILNSQNLSPSPASQRSSF